MSRLQPIKIPPHHRILFRQFLVSLAILIGFGSAFWAAHVTRAEFEVPLVDTTDFVPTEFRSIIVYNRQAGAGTKTYSDYEGFAVGVPTQPENGTSALYKFDGTKWVKMFPQGTRIFSTDYHLNAVAGYYRHDFGHAREVYLVGGKNTPSGAQRQAFLMALPNLPAKQNNYPAQDPIAVGSIALNSYNQPDAPMRASFSLVGVPGATADNAIPANSELYALGRPDIYYTGPGVIGYNSLAGGMNGWIAYLRAPLEGSNCELAFFLDPTVLCTTAPSTPPPNLKAYQENWVLQQFGSADTPSTSDNVTAINYIDENTAYLTTSTFPKVDPLDPLSQPKSPYEHDCSGSQTSKVFRVIGKPDALANWKKIATVVGECFYGLTASAVDVPSPANGPLLTEIWIASSKGVRRLTDDGTTYPSNPSASSLVKDTSGTPNQAVYSVTSTLQRSGTGQQLLLNGQFQSWAVGVNGTPPLTPSAWHPFIGTSSNGAVYSDGACSSAGKEIEKIDTGGANFAVRVEPGLLYSGFFIPPCTGTVVNANNIRTRFNYVTQTVPLSTIEGTRYRISGRYKVTATGVPVGSPYYTAWNDPANKPLIRQGGVMTRCYYQVLPNQVPCPFANLREIKTLSDADVGAADPGFTNFSFDLTRAFAQEKTSFFQITPPTDGLFLEIDCVATFGARTDCDDLKVEVVSDPPQPAVSVVQVFAVGQDGLALRNDDATGTLNTWVVDDANLLTPPAGSRTKLNSVVNAGGNHIFAAGSATTLFQRSIGNLSGYAWLGAAQPGTTGLGGLGWIATNCANLRDSTQRSLCQRQLQSFGLNLEKNSTTGQTVISGRAWFGKQVSLGGTNDDNEGLDLGTCEKPARLSSIPSSRPYDVTGSCNTNTRTCTANPTKACLTDFDCYGRCTGDQGYLCLSDTDCSAAKLSPLPFLTLSAFAATPAYNLTCNGGVGSSPNSCSAAGWLTFNAADLPGANTPPSAPAFGVTLNQTTGGLSGWGRFMTPANTSSTNYQADQGWVKFRGAASSPTGTKIYSAQSCKGPYVLRCSNDRSKSCTVGNESLDCGGNFKCVNSSTCNFGYDQSLQSCQPAASSCTNFCGGNINQPCTSNAECSSLWNSTESCGPIGYCSNTPNTPTTTCNKNADCVAAGSFCMFGAVCNVGAANSCNTYGVDFDETKGKFQGFAWSAEYGWLDFRSVQKGTNRFLQTRLGDVYSGGDIGSAATSATTQCNATYIVSAVGTISNFCTNLTGTGLSNFSSTQNFVPAIPFSSANNAFANALGRFDLTGIETVVSGGQNKYLQTVTTVTPQVADDSLTYTGSTLDGTSPIALNKTVFRANCSTAPGNTCKLTQNLKFRNADVNNNGAGILVVNGNLTITNNLQYVSSSIDDLRRLASLVVVVRGDLNIENQVTNLVGAYYVDGAVYTSPDATKDSSENHYPLTVRGLVIAKKFTFNRKFAGTVESPLPSELFIFDGRLQSNPLPGMIDFSSALPNTFNSSP